MCANFLVSAIRCADSGWFVQRPNINGGNSVTMQPIHPLK